MINQSEVKQINESKSLIFTTKITTTLSLPTYFLLFFTVSLPLLFLSVSFTIASPVWQSGSLACLLVSPSRDRDVLVHT